MKYIMIDERKNDIFSEEFNNKEDALRAAESWWGTMTKKEREKCIHFYVLESINPDEDAENHFDGEPLKEYK